MRELVLKLTLLEDAIINERPANEGGHAGLDYLPGFLLLGAAAARLYAERSRAETWRLFHSGQVRFGDALPLADDQPTWPIPLCWHERKGQPAVRDQWIVSEQVRNLQFGSFADNAQPKQLRAGYVRGDGRHLSIDKSFRIKTAIDPDTGCVAESELFGYQSINAGQSFVAYVRADDGFDADLWQRLVEVLTDQGELLLGRSRSAEYGRVALEPLDWSAATLEPPARAATDAQDLTLWCLSDIALVDEAGQPILTPTPAALGFPRATIAWDRTFLRVRRYALWNRHRDGYDVERQVIQHGSVIGLQLPSPLTEDEHAHLAAGVGLYREAGLGWVSINPALLAREEPRFAAPIDTPSVEAPSRPEHPLIAWLEAEQGGNTHRREAENQVKALREALEQRYNLARRYAGVPEHLPIGPSPAQWGTIYEVARNHDSRDLAGLKKRIFDDGDNALCKAKGENWQDPFRDNQGLRTFFDWFKAEAEALPSVQTLRLFTREAQRVASRQHGRSEHQESRT